MWVIARLATHYLSGTGQSALLKTVWNAARAWSLRCGMLEQPVKKSARWRAGGIVPGTDTLPLKFLDDIFEQGERSLGGDWRRCWKL
jgi:hypothetical protein